MDKDYFHMATAKKVCLEDKIIHTEDRQLAEIQQKYGDSIKGELLLLKI
jgi:hypothetical protein